MSDRRPRTHVTTPAREPWWRRVGGPTWLVLAAVVVAAVALIAIAPGGGSTEGTDGTAATAEDRSGVQGPVTGLERRRKGDPLAIGPEDAPVVMVEYSDFRCPFCARFARKTHPELVRRYVDSGVLRIEWRDFPIFGDQSESAAYAGRAAARQGRFWEFQERVFADAPTKGHAKLPKATLIAAARSAGIPDLARFERDMADETLREQVDADREQGLSVGVSSTPSFVINGTPVLGAQPLEAFVTAIEQARGGAR